jgi:hypothetical protein
LLPDGNGEAHAAQSLSSVMIPQVTPPEHEKPIPHVAGCVTVQAPRPVWKSSENSTLCARAVAAMTAQIAAAHMNRMSSMVVFLPSGDARERAPGTRGARASH